MAQRWSESLGGDFSLRLYNNSVTGNEALSFKTEGPNYLTEANVVYQSDWGSGEDAVELEGLFSLRGTDDEQFQVRDDTLRLQNVYFTARKRDHWEATAGYFNEQFTSYTMSTSLLGLNGYYSLTDDVRLSFFAGRDRRARGNNQFRRWASGSRINWSLSENHDLGFSYVQTRDQIGSLDESERQGIGDTLSNQVMSLDYSGRPGIEGMRMQAEFAVSDHDTSPTESGGENNNETAQLLELNFSPEAYGQFNASYEKVDPNFETESGFATQDRKRWRLGWRGSFLRAWSAQLQFEDWEDGLESTRQNEVQNWQLGGDYAPKRRGYWVYTFSASINDRQNEGRPASGDANEADERDYELSTRQTLGKNKFDLSYVYEDQKADSEINRSIDFGYQRSLEIMNQSLDYSFSSNYREEENELGSSSEIDRSVDFSNNLLIGSGQRERIELYHGYRNEHSDGASEIVTEKFGASYNYTLSEKWARELSASYSQNDVEDQGDPTQSYKEETVELNFSTEF